MLPRLATLRPLGPVLGLPVQTAQPPLARSFYGINRSDIHGNLFALPRVFTRRRQILAKAIYLELTGQTQTLKGQDDSPTPAERPRPRAAATEFTDNFEVSVKRLSQ